MISKLKGVSNKMTASKFKDDLLNIPNITFKKKKDGNYFCGLAEKAF